MICINFLAEWVYFTQYSDVWQILTSLKSTSCIVIIRELNESFPTCINVNVIKLSKRNNDFVGGHDWHYAIMQVYLREYLVRFFNPDCIMSIIYSLYSNVWWYCHIHQLCFVQYNRSFCLRKCGSILWNMEFVIVNILLQDCFSVFASLNSFINVWLKFPNTLFFKVLTSTAK